MNIPDDLVLVIIQQLRYLSLALFSACCQKTHALCQRRLKYYRTIKSECLEEAISVNSVEFLDKLIEYTGITNLASLGDSYVKTNRDVSSITQHASVKVIKYLLDKGFVFNDRRWFLWANNLPALQYFHDKAGMNPFNIHSASNITYSISNGFVAISKWLIGDSYTREEWIVTAAKNNQLIILEWLLLRDPNVKITVPLLSYDTCLHWLIERDFPISNSIIDHAVANGNSIEDILWLKKLGYTYTTQTCTVAVGKSSVFRFLIDDDCPLDQEILTCLLEEASLEDIQYLIAKRQIPVDKLENPFEAAMCNPNPVPILNWLLSLGYSFVNQDETPNELYESVIESCNPNVVYWLEQQGYLCDKELLKQFFINPVLLFWLENNDRENLYYWLYE